MSSLLQAIKSKEEIEENKKNEALRRKSGKDANEAKESLQLSVQPTPSRLSSLSSHLYIHSV
jgi:hypothetical protein